jgi:hypothetical protein
MLKIKILDINRIEIKIMEINLVKIIMKTDKIVIQIKIDSVEIIIKIIEIIQGIIMINKIENHMIKTGKEISEIMALITIIIIEEIDLMIIIHITIEIIIYSLKIYLLLNLYLSKKILLSEYLLKINSHSLIYNLS